MLQNLSEDIADCYRCAAKARARALAAHDPALQQDFLDMERRWMLLARSYEFTQRITDFMTEAERQRTAVTSRGEP
jgi:hypothetical protein